MYYFNRQRGRFGEFKYSTSGTYLLSAILTCATGKCAREYANEHLFRLIGTKVIPDYEMDSFGPEEVFGSKVKGWIHDPNGNSIGGWRQCYLLHSGKRPD
jgi:CubicO group peptidase (beta-lactamase class C family)